jgi:hypothetical protein
VVTVLDQQLNAAMVIDGFATPGHAFDAGELVLSTGVYPASAYSQAIHLMREIAKTDAQRSIGMARQFARPELRAAALMSVAEGMLGDSEIGLLSFGLGGGSCGGVF